MEMCQQQHDTFTDLVSGDVSIAYGPSSGTIEIEFERFESDDTIMPQYKVSVTMEHVAAWIQSVLTNQCGRRCKKAMVEKRKLDIMRRLTEKDADLVYYTHTRSHVVIIRNGCVLKAELSLHPSVGDFFATVIRESRCTDATTSVSQAFVAFVRGLMMEN